MTIANTINAECMRLATDAEIELYILDLNTIGEAVIEYYHCGTNGVQESIVFQGETYQFFPIQVTGFELSGQGQTPTPSMSVSNSMGLISQTVMQYADMVGAKVTRKRTFAKFLDGMPLANPVMEFAPDIFYIGRKTGESDDYVQFDLVTSFDLTDLSLPSRQVLQNSCSWVYKSAECTWVPVAGYYFDSNDNPTALPGSDACSKLLSGCQCRFARFGPNPVMPYAGYPGARKYV